MNKELTFLMKSKASGRRKKGGGDGEEEEERSKEKRRGQEERWEVDSSESQADSGWSQII